MKYLICALILFSLLVWSFFKKDIKRRAVKIFLFQTFEKKTRQGSDLILFLSFIVDTTADLILKLPRRVQNKILTEFSEHKYCELLKQVQTKEPALSVILKKFFAPSQKLFQIKSLSRHCHSDLSKLFLGLYYESTLQFEKLENLIKRIPKFYIKKRNRAIYLLLKARVLFYQTDMDRASKTVIKCIKMFQKLKLYDELAYSYFLMADIYRISGYYDTAHILLSRAEKIYQNLHHPFGRTFILAQKGLVFLAGEDIKNAYTCFEQAQDIFHQHKDFKHEAEMMNQLAFLYNLENKPTEALRLVKKARQIHQKFNSAHALAFSYEQLSRAYCWLGHYNKAVSYTDLAQSLYLKQKNHASFINMAAFKTELYLLLHDKQKAATHLRTLENYYKKHPKQCFDQKHIENLSQKIKN